MRSQIRRTAVLSCSVLLALPLAACGQEESAEPAAAETKTTPMPSTTKPRPDHGSEHHHAHSHHSGNGDMATAVDVDVVIKDGDISPAGVRIDTKVGQPVQLHVSSDRADEIHVHSQPDHSFAVSPGRNQSFAFRIGRPGVYEVESHETGTVIMSVAVTPG
jgi:hypothetical protein